MAVRDSCDSRGRDTGGDYGSGKHEITVGDRYGGRANDFGGAF